MTTEKIMYYGSALIAPIAITGGLLQDWFLVLLAMSMLIVSAVWYWLTTPHIKDVKGVRLYFSKKWINASIICTYADYDIDRLCYNVRRESDYFWGFLRFHMLQTWTETIQEHESRMK